MGRITMENIAPYIWWSAVDKQMSYGACVRLRVCLHKVQVSLV